MLAIMNSPAYWAFCWASGQVLARHILCHPEKFQGKRILDFGSGSGVVAIAAAMAGARQVVACDIDPYALDACAANAKLNGLEIELLDDMLKLTFQPDMIIAADVLYDRENFHFLENFPAKADEVLLADSRVKHGLPAGYTLVDRVTTTTLPDLDELREYSDVKIYKALSKATRLKRRNPTPEHS